MTLSPLENALHSLPDRNRRAMSERRFLHVLGVTHTVSTLARIHNLGVERGALAGLLHDFSKEKAPDKLKQELEAWGCPIPPEDRDFPKVWHGLHAAAWAGRELDIHDPELIRAVALHTTADSDFPPLAQALFIADFTEPGRPFPEAAGLFEAARRDLAEGFRQTLIAKVRRGWRKPAFQMHPRATRAVRAYLPAALAENLVSGRD